MKTHFYQTFLAFIMVSMLVDLSVMQAQETVTDIDGNVYNTVKIGTQTWLKENLKVLHNPDGSSIDNVLVYQNNPGNIDTYGRLYFWDAAMNNSRTEKAQGICPDNWHIPSFSEWNTLINYLGGFNIAGGKMKEPGTSHWNAPNTGASNSSGFTALPAGEKDHDKFQLLHEYAVMWSSTEVSGTWAKYVYLAYDDAKVTPYDYFKDFAYSVRCIKDGQIGIEEKAGQSLKVYPNPAHEKLTIEFPGRNARIVNISFINQTGIEIKKFRVEGSASTIDLGFLSPGFYILRVETAGKIAHEVLIKH
jgi:uncharacterized protein (TIGR02145 family)